MIDLINSSISPSPQAPTESTPMPPQVPPVPFTVQDRVTLSSDGENYYSGIDTAPA